MKSPDNEEYTTFGVRLTLNPTTAGRLFQYFHNRGETVDAGLSLYIEKLMAPTVTEDSSPALPINIVLSNN